MAFFSRPFVLLALLALLWIAGGAALLFLASRILQTILAYPVTAPERVSLSGILPMAIPAMACTTFGLLALVNGGLLLFRVGYRTSLWISSILLILFPVGTLLSIPTLLLLRRDEVRAGYPSIDEPPPPAHER